MKNVPTIRAVIAALFLLGAAFVVFWNSRSPLEALNGASDAYLVLNAPLSIASRVGGSELARALDNIPVSSRPAAILEARLETARQNLGSLYELLGWNYRIAISIGADGAPVTAINPGLIAPFGETLFRKAGFEDANIEGNAVMKKGDVAMAQRGGFWLVGDSSNILATIGASGRAELEASRNKLARLADNMNSRAPVSILLLPSAIGRYSQSAFGEKAPALLDDWAGLSAWDGIALSVGVGSKKLSVGGKLLVGESPAIDLFKYTGSSDDLVEFFPPQTLSVLNIGVPAPDELLSEALDKYSDRTGPKNILDRLDAELARELGVSISSLANHLKGQFASVRFLDSKGRERKALIAGLGFRGRSYLDQVEKSISPTGWQSSPASEEIRYFKRLLAYTVVDGNLIIASEPDTLSSYLEYIKEGDAPKQLKKLARQYDFAPIFYGGSIVTEGQASTREAKVSASADKMVWYAIALDRNDGEINVRAEVRGEMGPRLGPAWSMRFVMWMFGLMRFGLYIVFILSISSLMFRGAQIARQRRALS